MHEAGHGLYAHGISNVARAQPARGRSRRSASTSRRAARGRTSSAAAARSGRTGTSRSRTTFPDQLGDVDLETFLAAINRAEPGLIRVEADETTYSLHIILRFDIERQLIEGTLDPKDLPEAWNAAMLELLGVEVPNDAQGVLQDIHWSSGGIGYFPTYALGNVISLQIWAVVREAIPDLDAQMEAGELEGLSRLAARQPLLPRAQADAEGDDRAAHGRTAHRPQPYLAYLREKVSALPAGA